MSRLNCIPTSSAANTLDKIEYGQTLIFHKPVYKKSLKYCLLGIQDYNLSYQIYTLRHYINQI